jgi:hypothetical protein
MSTEKNILNKLNNLSSNLMIALYETRLLLNDVNRDLKKMDNDYFVQNPEIMQRLDDLLNENSLKELSFLLTDYRCYVQYKTSTCCNHNWTKDLIDIDPDKSKLIVYCSKCEVTQK